MTLADLVNILSSACIGGLIGPTLGELIAPWFIARCEARKLPDTIPDERTGG